MSYSLVSFWYPNVVTGLLLHIDWFPRGGMAGNVSG